MIRIDLKREYKASEEMSDVASSFAEQDEKKIKERYGIRKNYGGRK